MTQPDTKNEAIQDDDLEDLLDTIETGKTEYLITTGIVAFLFAAASAFITAFVYVNHFGRSLSDDREHWGVFGDFIGGILNPIVGLVTIYLVLMNLIVQRKELQSSLKEMRNSNDVLRKQNKAIEVQDFQNTFFNWLNSYNNIVSNIETTGSLGGPPYRGHAALTYLCKFELNNETYTQNLLNTLSLPDRELLIKSARVEGLDKAKAIEDKILSRWNERRLLREDFFEGGFRSLVNLIEWVSSQSTETISETKKTEYFRIIRSQLTNAERIFLLYESWRLEKPLQRAIGHHLLVQSLSETDSILAKFMLNRAKHLR